MNYRPERAPKNPSVNPLTGHERDFFLDEIKSNQTSYIGSDGLPGSGLFYVADTRIGIPPHILLAMRCADEKV